MYTLFSLKLISQPCHLVPLSQPVSPILAGSVNLWGTKQGLFSLVHPCWLFPEASIRWAEPIFCLAAVQVSIVQTGGFILFYTHSDLSWLGALFLENQNRDYAPLMDSLLNIKGCCESESRLVRVTVPCRCFSRPKICNLDGQYPMTCAPANNQGHWRGGRESALDSTVDLQSKDDC